MAPLLGTPKATLSKDLEMGICFHRDPTLWNMEECSFLGPLREGKNFLFRGIFMRDLRDM